MGKLIQEQIDKSNFERYCFDTPHELPVTLHKCVNKTPAMQSQRLFDSDLWSKNVYVFELYTFAWEAIWK